MQKPVSAHQQPQKEKSDAHGIQQLKHRRDIQSEMPCAMPTVQPQQQPGLKAQAILQQDARPRQQEQQKAEMVHQALDMTRQMRKPILAHQQLPKETSNAQQVQHLQQLPQIPSETPRAMPTMQPQQQQHLPGSKEPLVSQKDQRRRQQEASKAEVVQLALDMTRQTQKPISAHQQLPHEISPAQPVQHLQQLPQILSETPRAIPTMQPQQPGEKVQAISKQDARPRQEDQQKAEMVQLALDMARQKQKPVSAHRQLAKETSSAHQIHQQKLRPDIQPEMQCDKPIMEPQQQRQLPGAKAQAISNQDARPRQQEQQKGEIVHQALDMTREMQKQISAHQQLPNETSTVQQIQHLQQLLQILSETPCAMPTRQPQQPRHLPIPKAKAILQQDARPQQQEQQNAEMVQLALGMAPQMQKHIWALQQLPKETANVVQIQQQKDRPDIQSEMPCGKLTMRDQQQRQVAGPNEGFISQQGARRWQQEASKAEVGQLALDRKRRKQKPVSSRLMQSQQPGQLPASNEQVISQQALRGEQEEAGQAQMMQIALDMTRGMQIPILAEQERQRRTFSELQRPQFQTIYVRDQQRKAMLLREAIWKTREQGIAQHEAIRAQQLALLQLQFATAMEVRELCRVLSQLQSQLQRQTHQGPSVAMTSANGSGGGKRVFIQLHRLFFCVGTGSRRKRCKCQQ
ncbi:unnamed protein product [Toxocara canis]|uniref:ULP_PROTEASE domain-containing protein n=1 Tax=Toxocara canis TaxID=6265 RepID=A0A183VAH5_TOXCA|nr:unnamed protein product [Toxocara canis]